MNSDVKFAEVPAGVKFVQAGRMYAPRRIFIKLDMDFPIARHPNVINAVNLTNGEPRRFSDDVDVIMVS